MTIDGREHRVNRIMTHARDEYPEYNSGPRLTPYLT